MNELISDSGREINETLNEFLNNENELFKNTLVRNAIENFDLPEVYIYILEELLKYDESIKSDEKLISILLVMFIYLYNGSICIRKNENLYFILSSLGVANPSQLFEEFESNIEKYSKIVGNENEYKPLIYNREKGLLYFQKYYENEKIVKSIIKRKIELSKKGNIDTNLKNEILNFLQLNCQYLDVFQKVAIFLAITKDFLIISGGPGTGKTTISKYILKFLIEHLKYQKEEIALTAPTGKAAQRIKQILLEDENLSGINISTIHRLLNYRYINDSFYYNIENQLPYRVVIVDEVSMIDIKLLRHLLEAINDSTKLILIGDKDQLPSVEAGAFIARLVPKDYNNRFSFHLKEIVGEELCHQDGNDNIVILQKSFRSEKKIQQLSVSINRGEMVQLDKLNSKNFHKFFEQDDVILLYEYENFNDFKRLILKWLSTQFSHEYFSILEEIKKISIERIDEKRDIFDNLFLFLEKGIILSLTNVGLYGSYKINSIGDEYFTFMNNKQKEKIKNGLPLIITQNNYALNLFNGNIGILAKLRDGLRALFKVENEIKAFPYDILPPNETAFSISVHKSQGSEFDRVMLVIPDETKPHLLYRQIIYTGITRARKGILILGKNENLVSGIKRSVERESDFEYSEIFGAKNQGEL